MSSLPSDPFIGETEDFTVTYAGLTAAYFDADYQVYAAGGKRFSKDSGNLSSFLEWYRYSSFIRGTARGAVEWDNSRFQPDVVVINLGTNDTMAGDAALRSAARETLSYLRSLFPHSRIVWAYGMMLTDCAYAIRETVKAFGQTDGNAWFVALPTQLSSDGAGADGHPNVASNQRAFRVLASALESIMGWEGMNKETIR